MKKPANSSSSQIILGIDPGTRVSGFGLIRTDIPRYSLVDYGCIRPPSAYKLSDRYLVIFHGVGELIEKYQPDALVVETQYVQHNIQSAIKLGMARGAVMIAAKNKGIPVFEYSPTKAKKAVVGTGRASKHQVQHMIQRLLNMAVLPESEDAADALALAICHAQMAQHLKDKCEI